MSINVYPTTPQDIRPFIEAAFKYDKDLCVKYHAVGGDMDECVTDTYKRILEACNNKVFTCHKMMFGEDNLSNMIGFCVLAKPENSLPILYSYGINILYRNEQVKIEWLRWVEKELGSIYCVPINAKNKRAIGFFEKHGFEVKDQPEPQIVLLVKKQTVCP